MKEHWRGRDLAILAMLVLAAMPARAAVFEDFEGYTLGDQWHNDFTMSNVPAGWDRNGHYGLYDLNNVLEIRADPADANNQTLFISMQPEGSPTVRQPYVTWTAPAVDPWTGNFTVSFDLRMTQNHAVSTRVWLQHDNNISNPRLFINGDGSLVPYNSGTILGSIGTAAKDQWYRVIFDLDIDPYTGDPNNASFSIRAYEIASGGAALGNLLGEMTTPSLYTNTGAGFQQVRFDGRSTGRQEMYLDSMSVIPEPGSLLLLGSGAMLLWSVRFRRAAGSGCE